MSVALYPVPLPTPSSFPPFFLPFPFSSSLSLPFLFLLPPSPSSSPSVKVWQEIALVSAEPKDLQSVKDDLLSADIENERCILSRDEDGTTLLSVVKVKREEVTLDHHTAEERSLSVVMMMEIEGSALRWYEDGELVAVTQTPKEPFALAYRGLGGGDWFIYLESY